MAFILPELVGLARLKFNVVSSEDLPFSISSSYEFANGFDVVRVEGASDGANPIFIDTRNKDLSVVIFLTNPVSPGVASPSNQGGIKATFNVVGVGRPASSSIDLFTVAQELFPSLFLADLSGSVQWQYGDYGLAGTPYAKVDPMKALRFTLFPGTPPFRWPSEFRIDVSVFENPMTVYR